MAGIDMSFKATKIGGTSILTILGVVCLGTFLIAAFTWSTQTTASKSPQEVSLGTPSVNEWNGVNFFQANVGYEITMTATYNFHSGSQISYYVTVIASAGQGTIVSSDFSVSIDGIVGASLTESSPGVWTTGVINVPSSDSSDEITITIMPTTNALDLGQVSFAVSAQSAA
jgi:hypothetical protein